MGKRRFTFLLAVLSLAACTSRVVQDEPYVESPNTSPECVKLRTFLSQDLADFQTRVDEARSEWEGERRRLGARQGDPAFEKTIAAHAKLEAQIADPVFWALTVDFSNKVAVASSENCPEVDRIKRLHSALNIRRAPSPVGALSISEAAALEIDFEQRTRRHAFRLPGGNETLDREGYLARLAATPESAQREKLFKLFNSSRALRWSTWGFRDLVLLRNQVAESFGKQNFAELALSRTGILYEDVTALLEDIRSRVVPELQNRVSRLEVVGLSRPFQPWDIVWLGRSLLPKLTQEQTENGVVDSFLKGLGEDVLGPSSADLGTLSASWQGVRRRVADWATTKIPKARFPDSQGVLWHAIRALYDRLLHTMSFQTLLVRGPASAEMDRAMLVATIELIQNAAALDFELQMYREPDRDYSEIWAEKVQQYWGMKLEPFYSGWDEDSFLVAPFESLNLVLGTVTADFWLGALEENFPELWGNAALAARLKDRMQLLRPAMTHVQFTRTLTGRALNLRRYP